MADNTNRLELIISVKDDGSVVIDHVRKKIDDLHETTAQASAKGVSGLQQLKAGWVGLAAGVTAGYFIIKKGIDVIQDLVNVAAEAEQIEKRAAFQIEAWGYKFQEIKPYVDAFAESIQRTTRFSGEMAQQGLGQMMQYTSNIEEAMKGVQIAMNVSTQSGRDLNSMIQYVGLAMNGNVEVLSKWIPQLKDLESKLGANATEAGKWAYTQDLLNKMFGGASQADLKTYVGTVGQFQKSWSALKVEIGSGFLPPLKNTFDWLTKILKEMEKQRKLQKEVGFSFWSTGPVPGMPYYVPPVPEFDPVLEAMKKAAEQAANIPAIGVTPPEKDWIKKWVEDFDDLTYSYQQMGIVSQKTLSESASKTLTYMESIKKAYQGGKASVVDYMNALKAADDALKKLTGEDISKKKEEAWDKNAETIKGISKDEEGWLKKVNKANDELFKTLKEIDKLEIPTHADVGPMEREVNAMKEKLIREGLIIPVTTEGATGGGGGGGTPTWLGKPIGMSTGLSPTVSFDWPGLDEGTKAWNDFASQFPGGGKEFIIKLSGEGSSKKPITEKIREIIGEFGGLEKALSGMEAEINVAELSMERTKLQRQIEQINQYWQAWRTASSLAGSFSFGPGQNDPMVLRSNELMENLVQQLKINQMKMDYQRLRSYGGSYQTGTRYVPETGQYTLHEGERVTSRNVSSNITIINHISGADDPHKIADKLTQILKYRLNGELIDLLRR